ncbi:MAG: hypothetical protein UV73_C0003G0046 [Candidatus Gottesmanbacteria bacterium GW2011_GWA2_43_14]|uniref:Uncharacterized protein n=1 Tax=Candidatus Gottesmanbacteria bacterium GW2011_GWA2_43_14 TaxID=1618443 RepID=A0A0G1DKE4_9BACT|nr:MAG: hypothetical protein UV73_C0003G0046 [Candidatus Gottesmanbacteria bacterium GW2011_GWA2_43_14]
MLDERFVIAGVILSLVGGLKYLIDTVKGKTQPNKVTWFLWALAPLIAFAAEMKEGVGMQSLMTFIVGFNPLMIFLASFINRKSTWKLSSFDIICGGLSVLGLVLWQITKVGNLAIALSLAADGLAGVPTIVKAYRAPETESDLLYLLTGINAIITLATIDNWNFAHFAFPVYILLLCLLLFILVRFRIGRRREVQGNMVK